MIKRFIEFIKYVLGPTKTIEQTLKDIVETIDEENYQQMSNVTGAKLEVEKLKLIKGGKND